MFFEKLMEEFAHLDFRGGQGFPALRSGAVNTPEGFAVPHLLRAQIALLFETLEQRIQAARADAVAVARELFDHAQAEYGLLHRVMENMEPDEAGIEEAVGGRFILGFRFRFQSMNDSISRRSQAVRIPSSDAIAWATRAACSW